MVRPSPSVSPSVSPDSSVLTHGPSLHLTSQAVPDDRVGHSEGDGRAAVWKFALGANLITLEQAVQMIDLILATHFATKVKRKFELGVACAREQDRREVESAAVIQEIFSEEPDPGPAEAEVIEKFRAETIAEMLDEDHSNRLFGTYYTATGSGNRRERRRREG